MDAISASISSCESILPELSGCGAAAGVAGAAAGAGETIVARAALMGLERAVTEMVDIIRRAST